MPPAPLFSTLRARLTPLTRHRLVAAVLAPVLALVAFSAYVVIEKLDAYRRSADLLVAAQVARAAHGLARELEDERRWSAMYVGTDRESWRQDMEEQRNATDDRATDFRALALSPKAANLFGRQRNELGLGDLDRLRAVVDGDGDLHEVLEGYNTLISVMISSASKLAEEDVGNLISAYMDLGQVKDRLSRQRSIGTGWLLQGRADRDLLRLFAEAEAERKAFLQTFRAHASLRQQQAYDDTVRGPILDEIERLHQLATAGHLGPADADIWNRAHLTLIDLVGHAEERLATDMENVIHRKLVSAQVAFYLVVVVVVALVTFSLEALRRSERRAVVAEEESRKLFRAVEQSPVSVMITDTGGLIEYVNPAFTRMTGYSREEALGRNPRLLRSLETPPEVYAAMWQQISEGHDWRGELVNQRRDGTAYWEQMTIAPVKNAAGGVENFIAIKEDITEVRTLRQALEREHANVRRVLEAIHDGIALTDGEGGFQFANPAFVAQFGAIEGREAAEVFEAPLPAPAAAEAACRAEWRSPRSGRIYDLTAAWVHNPDGSRSLLQVFHDITVRKQAEEALNNAREAAELANRAKSEFLATMSHELRTPLNAIIGFSEIIEQQLLGPVGQEQYRDYAHDINDSGKHLLQLINDILDVARLEVGRVVLREERVSAAAIVQSCLGMVRERAEAGAVTVACDLPEGLPFLWADPRRLKQILVNVLGNAVKFTPPGGKVSVSVRADPKGLAIAIADTGIGIAPEDLGKVMAPFGQADSGMARRYEGSGLGLPLSRKLMDLHGGALSLESALGAGTTVTLRFPAERLRPAA
ncbi:MAG: nitrate- and nitrite sensing domain-containing protein [Magnetospirillum sp.]|nr:nitrate- and nitrite sensing domain-containing protein [Magnetospirillum sp.]